MLMAIALASAHDAAVLEIDELSAQLAVAPSAEAYAARALAHSDLGRTAEALDDLAAAEALGADVRLAKAALTRDVAVLGELDSFEANVLRAELAETPAQARTGYDAALEQAVTVDVALARAKVAADARDAALGLEHALDRLGAARVLELAVIEAWVDAGEPDRAVAWIDTSHARSPSPDLLLRRYALTGLDADREAALALAQERYDRNPNALRRAELDRARAAP